MQASDTATPANAICGKPALDVDRFAGEIDTSTTLTESLAQRPIERHRALEVFEARCDARALLWREGMIDLHTAVDELQDAAEKRGLVQDLGQDTVQAIMGNAFGNGGLES